MIFKGHLAKHKAVKTKIQKLEKEFQKINIATEFRIIVRKLRFIISFVYNSVWPDKRQSRCEQGVARQTAKIPQETIEFFSVFGLL